MGGQFSLNPAGLHVQQAYQSSRHASPLFGLHNWEKLRLRQQRWVLKEPQVRDRKRPRKQDSYHSLPELGPALTRILLTMFTTEADLTSLTLELDGWSSVPKQLKSELLRSGTELQCLADLDLQGARPTALEPF